MITRVPVPRFLRSQWPPRSCCAAPPAAAVLALALVVLAPANAAAWTIRRAGEGRAVRVVDLNLVDTRRSTPSAPGQASSPTRTLPTTVRYPTTSTIRALPLVVLAHGLNGHPDQLDDIAETWARAGFVVATPRFPRTNVDENGKAMLADVAHYPGDLSFVITRLVAASRTPGPLAGRIDPRHIGAAGVSLGGMAVYGLVSNTCCRDQRVDAAILMAAVRPPFPHGRYLATGLPMMLVHGDADTGYRYSARAYPDLRPPKWFLTLRGGRHGPPFEDPPDEFDSLVRTTTTAFWRRYLLGDVAAEREIEQAVRKRHGHATLECDLGTSATTGICRQSH